MDQRLLAGGVALLGAYAMPSPSVMAIGWLGSRPSFFVLLLLAAVAFVTFVGAALGIWKVLTKQWPPREAIAVLVIVVGARMILDVVRMMGLWIL